MKLKPAPTALGLGFFILLTNLASAKVSGSSQKEQLTQIETFIVQAAEAHFGTCNLVVAHDASTNDSKLASTIHSLMTRLFATHGRDVYLLNYATFAYNVTNITGNATGPSVVYPSKLGAISKLRPNCVLTTIFLERLLPETFTRLYQLLIPPTYELTKKDEDHYFIVTPEQLAEPVLLSQEFTMRLQYKLLIHSTSGDKGLQFKTVCFYCKLGPAQKETIVSIPLTLQQISGGSVAAPEQNGSRIPIPSKSAMFPEVVRNLNGYQMRVVCPTGTHQQARMKQVNGDWLPMRGSYFLTMDNLVRVFNFTYKVGPSTLGGTGLQQPNGTWIGTVGDILYERADIGLVTAITYQRYKYIGYNYPVTWEWLTFATAIPVASFTWEALFWPFSKELWLGLILSLLIVITIFICLRRFEAVKGIEAHTQASDRRANVAESSTYIWGTLLEQSLAFPVQNPLKVLMIFWVFLVLILTTGYRSKLVTCLAFPVIEKPPGTFDELAESGYKVGLCYVGGAAYNVFKSSNNPTYVKLYKVMELFKDMTDCFVRTLHQRVSCIGYESMASYVLNKNLTDRFGRPKIQVTTASTFFVGCGYVIQKRAIFRPNFDRYIMTWMDMGLLGEWRKIDHESVRRLRAKWEIETHQERDAGHAAGDDGPSKLSVGNLKVVFILLVLGVGAGGLAFIWELLRFHGVRRIAGDCRVRMAKIDEKLNYIR